LHVGDVVVDEQLDRVRPGQASQDDFGHVVVDRLRGDRQVPALGGAPVGPPPALGATGLLRGAAETADR